MTRPGTLLAVQVYVGATLHTAAETPTLGSDADRERAVVIVYGNDATRLIELVDGGQLTIGRARTSTIHIESERVSRNHARIARIGSHITVEDLGSRNGTWLDGVAIAGMRRLASGDALTIGPATLVLSLTTRAVLRPRIYPVRYLEDRLGAEVERAHVYQRVFSLVRIRVDGEMVDVAQAICRITAAVRHMDLVAEYSPTELVIVMPELDAKAASDRARALIKAASRGVPFEVMVGVAAFPEHGTTGDELIARAGAAVRQASAGHVRVPPREEPVGEAALVADPQMRRVYELVRRVASHSMTVLVQGETGVGKEMVAAAIHHASERKEGPLVRLNCASLPESLLETALFGHERGAFTGAGRQATGYFEAARGGTLFLDEIGEMSSATQVKLLRVLEERSITRVGGTESIPVDVRIVCATNRDLETDAGRGTFRTDLYFRISAFTILVPALRDRRAEILLLAEHFLGRSHTTSRRVGRPPMIAASAADALQHYDWPGNVRELRNAIERAYVVHEGGVIELEDLPERVTEGRLHVPRSPDLEGVLDVRDHVAAIERSVIASALAACGGSQTEAAKKLGMSRRALIYRMEKHGLKPLPASAAKVMP